MSVLVLGTRAVLHQAGVDAAEAAIDVARLQPGTLNSPLHEQEGHWVQRLWDTALGAIEAAWEGGSEAAGALIKRFEGEIGELRQALVSGAQRVVDEVAERLAGYARGLTSQLLRQFQDQLSIGGRDFRVNGLTIQQRFKMTGSLKASLKEICSLVSEGELSISATYAV
ncbi:hypothetical protein AAFN86_27070 [Roseomonas sp. CAU 1739]|uniref:hypothetical protein n=1 Tax=Roseomonas sp. CAU 1739 TaxID=3140364 RepID=UPI00325C20D5